MKIYGPYGVNSVTSSRRRRGKSADGFAQMLEDAYESTESGASAASLEQLSGVAGILSLQEMSDAEVARRRAVSHGHKALDMLAQLQRELLTGVPAAGTLQRMQQQLEGMEQELPPRLLEVLTEIRLRVAVELAKWSRKE